ncbi:MAG: acyl carrier protein [Eubacteriales bacterium]|nr:acyl carrier protein [Eubacteriales bacterium]
MELLKLQKIIGKILQIEPSSVKENMAFVEDLGANSLDLFEMMIEIEGEYDIEIDQEAAERILTVHDAVEAIQMRTGYKNKQVKPGKKA